MIDVTLTASSMNNYRMYSKVIPSVIVVTNTACTCTKIHKT